MRNRRARQTASAARVDDDEVPFEATPRRARRDLVAWAGLAVAALAILVNALFLQKGPHPAPIFANKPPPPRATSSESTGAVILPRPRPIEMEPVRPDAPPRPRVEIITDIQKELARRAFYDGAADGLYGAKTDAAIRDFEQAAGLKSGNELNENLLRMIARSNVSRRNLAELKSSDAITELLAPPKRVLAVQRALADFGYGQIKPTGVFGPDTQAAIERFERDRKLPVSGQLTDTVTRELAAMTGRPLE